VDCQTQNQLDAAPPGTPVRQFLQPEILLTATGALQGYTETAAGGILTQPTVGGLASALTRMRTNPRYEQVLDQAGHAVPGLPLNADVTADMQ
jgi:hypothetical protein